MLNYLIGLVARLGLWGYAVIFSVAALECAAFVGVLVPGEGLVLVAGMLAQRGALDLDIAIWAVLAGAILGDSIGYELGRHLGRPWLLAHGHRAGLTLAHVARIEAFFEQHGSKAVLLGRFVGFARALVPFVAGSSRMRYRVFLFYNAIGAILWGVAFVLLGYSLGASWQVAERWAGRVGLVLGSIAMAAAIAAWWVARVRARRSTRAAPAIAGTEGGVTPVLPTDEVGGTLDDGPVDEVVDEPTDLPRTPDPL